MNATKKKENTGRGQREREVTFKKLFIRELYRVDFDFTWDGVGERKGCMILTKLEGGKEGERNDAVCHIAVRYDSKIRGVVRACKRKEGRK